MLLQSCSQTEWVHYMGCLGQEVEGDVYVDIDAYVDVDLNADVYVDAYADVDVDVDRHTPALGPAGLSGTRARAGPRAWYLN